MASGFLQRVLFSNHLYWVLPAVPGTNLVKLNPQCSPGEGDSYGERKKKKVEKPTNVRGQEMEKRQVD